MSIVLESLSHEYMTGTPLAFPAIRNVSLTIEEGEFLGLIGHTGSGKSTLVQHMNSLLMPTGGSVLVDGLDVREKKNRPTIRAKVGMVFQYPEYQLFAETVREDVGFGPKNMKLTPEQIEERVTEALTFVGLAPKVFASKSPFDLSGGEKRRAALAGILAMRPQYLVLDEPMAGLDPRGRVEILDMIENLRRTTGCAVIMVSHSMDDIARYADRVVVLAQGEIAMSGSPSEVFSQDERLLSFGLDIPQATRLSSLLRFRGLEVPNDIYRMDRLRDWLLKRWRA